MPSTASDETRHHQRTRALARAKKEKIPYSKALYLVRRSDILVHLSRLKEGSALNAPVAAVAKATGVPNGVVRKVFRELSRSAVKRFEALSDPGVCQRCLGFYDDRGWCTTCLSYRLGFPEVPIGT